MCHECEYLHHNSPILDMDPSTDKNSIDGGTCRDIKQHSVTGAIVHSPASFSNNDLDYLAVQMSRVLTRMLNLEEDVYKLRIELRNTQNKMWKDAK